MMTPQPIFKTATVLLAASAFAFSAASAQLVHYDFDEASSGSQDAINHGTAANANGSFVGNATRTGSTPSGFTTGALDTTGATSGDLRYVTAGDVAELDSLAAFTVTAWVNLQADPTGNHRIVSKQAPSSFAGFSINTTDAVEGARSASNFGLRTFIGGETAFAFDDAGQMTISADNTWTFIAISYDGTSSSANVDYYSAADDLSGSVVHLATTTINAGTTVASSAAFNIGHTDAAPTSNTALPGFLDDVRVYGQVLTQSELEAVRLEAIPEPSTYAAIFGGAALLFVGLRRFRRSRS